MAKITKKSKDLESDVESLKSKVSQSKAKLNKDDILNIVTNGGREKEYYEEYIHMFVKLKAGIRKLEKLQSMSPSTRNVYALIAMYSQQREIIADIRALSDFSENVNAILSTVIQPLFSSITQSNLDVFYHIRKLLIENCKDETTQSSIRHLETLMRDQAKFLQEKYESTSTNITKVITSR